LLKAKLIKPTPTTPALVRLISSKSMMFPLSKKAALGCHFDVILVLKKTVSPKTMQASIYKFFILQLLWWKRVANPRPEGYANNDRSDLY
jgi:hypothetical protein